MIAVWARRGMRALFSLLFVASGVAHFTNRAFFVSIVPPYLPWPGALVAISGIAEIVLAIGLWIPGWSRAAAWGLAALLIAVFPANIHMNSLTEADVRPTTIQLNAVSRARTAAAEAIAAWNSAKAVDLVAANAALKAAGLPTLSW